MTNVSLPSNIKKLVRLRGESFKKDSHAKIDKPVRKIIMPPNPTMELWTRPAVATKINGKLISVEPINTPEEYERLKKELSDG